MGKKYSRLSGMQLLYGYPWNVLLASLPCALWCGLHTGCSYWVLGSIGHLHTGPFPSPAVPGTTGRVLESKLSLRRDQVANIHVSRKLFKCLHIIPSIALTKKTGQRKYTRAWPSQCFCSSTWFSTPRGVLLALIEVKFQTTC